MRMASNILAIMLAVMCAAVAGAGDVYPNATRVRRAAAYHHSHRVLADEDMMTSNMAWKRSHWQGMQSQLLHDIELSQDYSECCPSVVEMVAPKGGKTPSGLFVELFEDGENKQQLYEVSCAKGVVGKRCRFVDARLYNQSRCVQKYSYSYALVRRPFTTDLPPHRHRREGHFSVPGSGGWSMDYVQVRAGCECQITPPRKLHKKRQERHKRKKKTRRLELLEDDDET